MTSALQTQETSLEQVDDRLVSSNSQLLHLSSSPHFRHPQTVPMIMNNVIIALLPATLAAIIIFRVEAIILIITGILSSVLTEWIFCFLTKRPNSLKDYSAIITGLLLSLSMPPFIPWWVVAMGSIFSISVIKMAFGGLGCNLMNPALGGRLFVMISFPVAMTTSWKTPSWGTISGLDSISSATPIAYFKEAMHNGAVSTTDLQNSILHLFIGNVGGCIGETSAFALLLGALWLWYKKVIGFKIPVSYVAIFFILSWVFNGTGEYFTIDALLIPVFQVLAGSLLLGALFMANDSVTTPVTPIGKIIFGLGCGVLTFGFRTYTNFPEGVCFSILLMNLLTPLLDKYTRPKIHKKVS